jgi:hypothetical protein
MFAAKYRVPHNLAASRRPDDCFAPTLISSKLSQEPQKWSFVFSRLCTLLTAPKLQAIYFHPLPHSLTFAGKLTAMFPVTSALFVRSSACVQVSTPLCSINCALFAKTTREGVGVPIQKISARGSASKAKALPVASRALICDNRILTSRRDRGQQLRG